MSHSAYITDVFGNARQVVARDVPDETTASEIGHAAQHAYDLGLRHARSVLLQEIRDANDAISATLNSLAQKAKSK